MKYLVWCLNFLFVISTVCTAIQVTAPSSIKLERGDRLKIQCNVTPSDAIEVEWKKDNSPLLPTNTRVKTQADSKTGIYTLKVESPGEKDLGNYTCAFKAGTEEEERTVQVTGQVLVKVPANINVVEGEKLRIHCQVAGGGSAPALAWSFSPDGLDNNVTVIEEGGRYSLEEDEHKIPDSILIVKDITMNDRGHFHCSSKADPNVNSKTMVRVKDKYAALWPFLGIVAEVVILCAIIFVYEKKHNKAELDESDTDQSPDQKNTPDHGKDGLRHRQ